MGESESQANRANDEFSSLEQDFEALQRHFAAQLSADIDYLEAEKQRLQVALAKLRAEFSDLEGRYRALKTNSEAALTQQQLAQQQRWAKQMAKVLAHNLREDLHKYVLDAGDRDLPNPTRDWLTSLDSSLSQTVQSLQRDLSSYQSAMAQQLTRMQTMEQQGEVILESLVNRLSQQLQAQLSQGSMAEGQVIDNRPLAASAPRADSPLPLDPVRQLAPSYPGQTVGLETRPPAATPSAARSTKGLVLSAIAALLLVLHTLLVGAIARGGTLAGLTFAGIDSVGFMTATALLWLRLMVFMPLLLLVASQLYPGTWSDLGRWRRRPGLLLRLVGGGVFLFFSQVLLYQSVGAVGPAIATTLLFGYPLLAIPLGWLVQKAAPSPLRWVVAAAILMGCILAARPASLSAVGLTAGALAAVAFALYITSMNLVAQRQCHPVSSGVVQFATMTLLATVLVLLRPAALTQGIVGPGQWIVAGLGLGLLSLLAYGFNFAGLRLLGGNRSALVAATTPLLTAILSGVLLSAQPPLQLIQWTGVALVTLGVLSLSLDRLARAGKASHLPGQRGQRRGRDSNPR